MSTTEHRGTSRTEPSLAELLAHARFLLRDAGIRDAFALDDQDAAKALDALDDDATRHGRTLEQHVAQLRADRLARLHATSCACGALRPCAGVWPSPMWGAIDGAAACPACIAVERAA